MGVGGVDVAASGEEKLDDSDAVREGCVVQRRHLVGVAMVGTQPRLEEETHLACVCRVCGGVRVGWAERMGFRERGKRGAGVRVQR